MIESIRLFFNIVCPRFINEYAACTIRPDGQYEPVCSVDDLEEGEIPEGVVLMSLFNFFGFALFPKVKGEVLTWQEYQDLKAKNANSNSNPA